MVKPVFIKAQASSLIASGVDFCVTIISVELLLWKAVTAGAVGTITGGIVNFLLGRQWVFKAKNEAIHIQVFRYILVWLGNLGLNIAGMALLVNVLDANYVFAKIFVSVLVGICYNYVLQKKYVFK